MFLVRISLLALFLATASPATANPQAAVDLADLLKGVNSFSAAFVQTTLNASGRSIRTQRGTMQVARSNKFRWQVDVPLPLLVVSDGNEVYIYDEDLAQVTVSKLDPQQLVTPAILLSGKPEWVSQNFVVLDKSEDKRKIFRLTPRNVSSPYVRIQLAFEDNKLVQIEMEDSFGQFSIVDLAVQQVNDTIDQSLFRFAIPPNVDVFRNAP